MVEDDYDQACDIMGTLMEHGAKVVGPFSALEECFQYWGHNLIDAAILDVKVGDATSFPAADRLLSEGIPFLFLTGYDREIIPSRFQRVRHYLKPFVGQDVPIALALVMASGQKFRRPTQLVPAAQSSATSAIVNGTGGEGGYGRRHR
ncbi:response regulator [Neorhizobium lilium]|uniref:Response regulator n=1 Tax=Neorhizobium lilium TaxID=2503024 RepID=A0A3S3T371_9HYPH|nr:response regulator [Neorhizobium lilium]RWX81046.1 response regulator [Neorhizobium lilium]